MKVLESKLHNASHHLYWYVQKSIPVVDSSPTLLQSSHGSNRRCSWPRLDTQSPPSSFSHPRHSHFHFDGWSAATAALQPHTRDPDQIVRLLIFLYTKFCWIFFSDLHHAAPRSVARQCTHASLEQILNMTHIPIILTDISMSIALHQIPLDSALN
jgi:hypothetical protein